MTVVVSGAAGSDRITSKLQGIISHNLSGQGSSPDVAYWLEVLLFLNK